MRDYWPFYLMGAPIVLVVLTIFRGLSWQWWGILTASPAVPPAVVAPAAPAPAARQPAGVAAPAPAPAPNAPAAGAKRPLPPSNDPPP
ncbi:MAG TPA: hypothetical protein VFX49_02205, partial [Chloroflexota bacterium]|nr:hypothetical protein [Chloroflexota bacterium]